MRFSLLFIPICLFYIFLTFTNLTQKQYFSSCAKPSVLGKRKRRKRLIISMKNFIYNIFQIMIYLIASNKEHFFELYLHQKNIIMMESIFQLLSSVSSATQPSWSQQMDKTDHFFPEKQGIYSKVCKQFRCLICFQF